MIPLARQDLERLVVVEAVVQPGRELHHDRAQIIGGGIGMNGPVSRIAIGTPSGSPRRGRQNPVTLVPGG